MIHFKECLVSRRILCFVTCIDQKRLRSTDLQLCGQIFELLLFRLATRLRVYNPHWSGDRVFFEARKIVGAMMQHITFSAWLPKVLGRQIMQKIGRYGGYKEEVSPAISNVFATAAFRFGHTLINPVLYRLNESFAEVKEGHLPLHKAFFAPHKLVQDGGIDPILRGLLAAGVKKVRSRKRNRN